MSLLLQYLLERDDFRRARLPALYADFRRLNGTNPEGFTSNAQTWENGLRDAAREALMPESKDTFLVSLGPHLDRALEIHDFGRPMAIEAALTEAAHNGRAVPLGDFLRNAQNAKAYYPRWIARLWSSIGLRYPSTRDSRGQYVFLESVKDTARRVLSHLQKASGHAERILPLNLFEKEVNKALTPAARITTTDLKVLLTYLVSYERSLLFKNNVIRVKGAEEDVSELSASDMEIASIKKLICDLSGQVEDLSSKVLEAEDRARAALRAQQRALAMQCLRRKVAYEDLIKKRTGILMQLEDAYDRIQDAVNRVQFLKAIQLSTSILQSLNSELGSPENMSAAMDELQDEISLMNIAAEPLEIADGSGIMQDNEEIQAELEKMERQQTNERPNPVDEQRVVHDREPQRTSLGKVSSVPDPGPAGPNEVATPPDGRTVSGDRVPLSVTV